MNNYVKNDLKLEMKILCFTLHAKKMKRKENMIYFEQ